MQSTNHLKEQSVQMLEIPEGRRYRAGEIARAKVEKLKSGYGTELRRNTAVVGVIIAEIKLLKIRNLSQSRRNSPPQTVTLQRQMRQALELGENLRYIAGEIVPTERENPQLLQLHKLRRQTPGEIVVVHVENFEVREIQDHLGRKRAVEGVPAEIDVLQRGQIRHFEGQRTGEVDGGESEVDEPI